MLGGGTRCGGARVEAARRGWRGCSSHGSGGCASLPHSARLLAASPRRGAAPAATVSATAPRSAGHAELAALWPDPRAVWTGRRSGGRDWGRELRGRRGAPPPPPRAPAGPARPRPPSRRWGAAAAGRSSVRFAPASSGLVSRGPRSGEGGWPGPGPREVLWRPEARARGAAVLRAGTARARGRAAAAPAAPAHWSCGSYSDCGGAAARVPCVGLAGHFRSANNALVHRHASPCFCLVLTAGVLVLFWYCAF